MNAYVSLQQALVAARQDALRAEADTTRLLSSTRPLPAVSAGRRTEDMDRLPAQAPVAVAPRSLGAAAAASRPSAGKHRTGVGAADPCSCDTVAPAA